MSTDGVAGLNAVESALRNDPARVVEVVVEQGAQNHRVRDLTSEAKRLVQNGAFEFSGEKVADPLQTLTIANGQEFRAGRHRKGERVKQPLIAPIVLEDV